MAAAGSDAVRAFVLDNVRLWIRDYHLDGLRLDAIHAIDDSSPRHILREIKEAADAAAAPLGVRATLASAHQAISSEDAALQALGPVFAKLIQSDDAKESARALQEHRAPVFRGT